MALSSDETYLIAGAKYLISTTNTSTLGKIDASTGALLASYATTG